MMTSDILINCQNVSLGYHGRAIVAGLDLQVVAGQVVALVGGDGAGKTTVLRAFSGRLPALSGSLTLPPPARIGVMPEAGAVFGDLTVTENLDFVSAAHGRGRTDHAEVLQRMGLTDAADRLADRLSGGMRQKLALAMALTHRPRLLLLDEPTTGVDPVSRAEIWLLLSEQVAVGTTVVMATTYLDEASRASTVVVLDGGSVIEQGPPAAIRRRTPGVILKSNAPLGANAWRRGRRWHSWFPSGSPELGDPPKDRVVQPEVVQREVVQPDLEDAVVVAALRTALRTKGDSI